MRPLYPGLRNVVSNVTSSCLCDCDEIPQYARDSRGRILNPCMVSAVLQGRGGIHNRSRVQLSLFHQALSRSPHLEPFCLVCSSRNLRLHIPYRVSHRSLNVRDGNIKNNKMTTNADLVARLLCRGTRVSLSEES